MAEWFGATTPEPPDRGGTHPGVLADPDRTTAVWTRGRQVKGAAMAQAC